MSRQEQLARPIDAYKAIIEELVTETSHGISERLVTQEGIFSRATDKGAFNTFVRSLALEQREMVAKMLQVERIATIHDVLSVFSWWREAGEVGLTFRGEPMPLDLSGMGMHGDYVGRQHDWEPPNGQSPIAE